MSADTANAFFAKIKSDKTLLGKLKVPLAKNTSPKAASEAVVRLAAQVGFSFTIEGWARVHAQSPTHLSMEQLSKVSGGLGQELLGGNELAQTIADLKASVQAFGKR